MIDGISDPEAAGAAAEEMTGDAEVAHDVKMSAYAEHLMQWAKTAAVRGG